MHSGFHDFDLACKHIKLLKYRLANSTSVDTVDQLTGYSNADILNDDFHKLGFTNNNQTPALTELRQCVVEHSKKLESTTQQEIEEEIKQTWKRFERGKDDCVRRLSTRLSNVGTAILKSSSKEEEKMDENVIKPLPLVNDTKSKEEDEFESLKALLNFDIEAEIAEEDMLSEYKTVMSQIDSFTANSLDSSRAEHDTTSTTSTRALKRRRIVWCDDALRSAFDAVDEDKSGTLSVDEVANLMAALSPKSRKSVRQRQIEAAEFIEKYDENSDGMLDFDEFSKMMQIYSSGGESGHHESI